ncbi:MAG TPA: aminotransferase class IV, partial [Chitinophagaceae bacterium]|nr:aminotransferase class IV [Chitinophagaceae bacterium]
MNNISLNGVIIPASEPALTASNRSFRYGEGLFETMRVKEGSILLAAYHFDRLFSGLATLKIEIPPGFNDSKLQQEILHLCTRNECTRLARVRLSVSREEEPGKPGSLQWLIEASPLEKTMTEWNEKGLRIDIYPLARKSCDAFANLKSTSYLPYAMAAAYAKDHQWDDCLVLNNHEAIADSSIANVFIIKNGEIRTPAISEGCIQGVMRRFVLEQLEILGYRVKTGRIGINDLEEADEVFLTNAIRGIRWVRQFRDKKYSNGTTLKIYRSL